jgi:hypothetical protein
VINKSSKESIDIVVGDHSFLEILLKLAVLLVIMASAAVVALNRTNELLIESSQIEGRQNRVRLLVAGRQQTSIAAQILLLALKLKYHVERVNVASSVHCNNDRQLSQSGF